MRTIQWSFGDRSSLSFSSLSFSTLSFSGLGLSSLGLVGLLSLCACGGGPSSSEPHFEDSVLAPVIVEDFAYKVVVPTYELLATRLAAMDAAALTLQATPSAENLLAAQDAWRAARRPWEQSEGFLFGPVDARGIDPALDSWPVNRTDLEAVLSSGEALTDEFMASLDPTLKGFHTAEYLLFGSSNDQSVDALQADPRRLQYLVGVSAEMAELGEELALAWTTGLEGAGPYAEQVATAGSEDNRIYPSRTAAAEELVRGAIGILDEVANGKIADPFQQQDPSLVESQFSFNSLADFSDNIRSVQNAYLGNVPEAGTSGTGIGAFFATLDEDLDARIQVELQDAIDAILRIPPPFRDAITDPDAADEIVAAQDAIRVAKDSFERDLLPRVTQ